MGRKKNTLKKGFFTLKEFYAMNNLRGECKIVISAVLIVLSLVILHS